MNLLLLSNSRMPDGRYLAHARDAIAALAAGRRRALFLPFAGVTVDWDAYTAIVREAMAPIGLEIEGAHRIDDPHAALAAAELVLVGGGSTFRLLAESRRRGWLDALPGAVRAGLPYAGWSAGSVLACPTIRTTNDMPIVDPGGPRPARCLSCGGGAWWSPARPPASARRSRTRWRGGARSCRSPIADRDATRLATVADALRAEGASVEALVCDVADPATAPALAERAIALWGGADVVVNNAGVALVGPVETMPEADARWLMDINFWGVVRGCRAFVPQLRGRPAATLVNVSSVFAFVAPPTQAMYAASKAAVRAFSDVLREELRDSGVRVLAVHPGGIRTRIVESARVVDLSVAADSKAALDAQFRRTARTTPQQAAAAIVRAIERGDTRLLIGIDARLGDWMFRLAPGRAGRWFAALARRAREAAIARGARR
jgi:NAD(P)-dependent dehydrogenase (short-subunit alcohol dehydrogenase family)